MMYVASKTKYAPYWRMLKLVLPIRARWINLDGEGEIQDWGKFTEDCFEDIQRAQFMVMYCAKDEHLKGAWIELGMAIATRTPVYAFGHFASPMIGHRLVTHCGLSLPTREEIAGLVNY